MGSPSLVLPTITFGFSTLRGVCQSRIGQLLALLQAIVHSLTCPHSHLHHADSAGRAANSKFPYFPLKSPNGVQLGGSGALEGGNCSHGAVGMGRKGDNQAPVFGIDAQ